MKQNAFSLAAALLVGTTLLAGCADQPVLPVLPEGAAPRLSETTDGAARHVVVFGSTSVPQDFDARVAALGGAVETAYPAIGVAVVTGLDDEAAASLQAGSDVQLVERDHELQILEPVATDEAEALEAAESVGEEGHQSPGNASFFPRQWNLRQIGADRAWAAGYRGSSRVTVAILDTGIDHTHPDLQGRVDLSRSRSFVTWRGEEQLRAYFFPHLPITVDMRGHGTHVAATVSSNGHVTAGVTQDVTLMAVKVLSAQGSGTTSGVLAGIMYSADNGADVINMSLGSTFDKRQYPGFNETINRAVTYANGRKVTVVVSAGNDDADLDQLGSLYKTYCSAPTVVCVSATGPTSASTVNGPWTDLDARAPYSNYGREFITVAAPGGSTGGAVWAPCSKQRLNRSSAGYWSRHTCAVNTHLNYAVGMNGTSMASPHTAGLAALLVERHGKNSSAVREALQKFSDDLGEAGKDPIYGKGRINVAKALGL